MWAVIANGIQTICKTQESLNCIIAMYPYPKFQLCRTVEEARDWLRRNQRGIKSMDITNYGDTGCTGYAVVKYSIGSDNRVRYEVDTSRVGFIKVVSTESIVVDNRLNKIIASIIDVKLDDSLIQHHVIAIQRILKLLGEYVDVTIVVPDMSVYLALTMYSGKSYLIKGTQDIIRKRLGAVSFTVKEESDKELKVNGEGQDESS